MLRASANQELMARPLVKPSPMVESAHIATSSLPNHHSVIPDTPINHHSREANADTSSQSQGMARLFFDLDLAKSQWIRLFEFWRFCGLFASR